ncbi:hypothetical protein K439DRAFT_402255 [Ramaria rubella]|nr:hypothetical protein K439DRAFT_402255 [Ramaria rubella]
MSDVSTVSTGVSIAKTTTIGIVIAGAGALGLAIALVFIFVRRRKRQGIDDEESAPQMMKIQPQSLADQQGHGLRPQMGLVRSVSRHNLTQSIVLPMPLPPVPAARPRPPKVASPMLWSRSSFVSSLRSSFSSARPGASDLRKVRRVFAPLLPDELVLRPGEKLSLIQSYNDGWCTVGRKSPFHAPALSKANGYGFGQGYTADEIEVGVVPAWVFETAPRGCAEPARPIREESLGIKLVGAGEGGVREEVISWSNF